MAIETVENSSNPSQFPAILPRAWGNTTTTFKQIVVGPLPADVSQEEYSTELLFRASMLLNYVTGGQPDMTFSARCFGALLAAKRLHAWLFWRWTGAGIDAFCGAFRGETDHCYTAWKAYHSRPKS